LIPKCKIETYTGATLDYTITDDILTVHTRDVLNGVGSFSFALPVEKGTSSQGYNYTDIALNDTVKVYFWYDDVESAPSTPSFAGKICKISGVMSKEQGGFFRVFSGKSLSEVLERNILWNKGWQNTAASTIVQELATDLGIYDSNKIESDTTQISLSAVETYLDALKDISDYWVDGNTQVKKDFYVDVDGDLVWKSRPIRSSGVETLTVGENILSYDVLRSLLPVKNKIHVFGGAAFQNYHWCESLSNWTALKGAMDLPGDYIRVECDENKETDFYRTTSPYSFLGGYKPLHPKSIDHIYFEFQMTIGVENPSFTVMLEAPDSSNYFYQTFTGFQLGAWIEKNLETGPDGNWSSSGSPSWGKIYKIRFQTSGTITGTYYILLTGLKCTPLNLYGFAEDATSKNSYGVRELQYVDSLLQSDSLCEQRAETLLYQLKDPPVRVDLTINGNTNVKIGDRLSLTIPAENISAQNFDVLVVEHNFVNEKFTTKASLVSAGDIRQLPSGSPLETVASHLQTQKKVARGIQLVK